MGQIIIAKAAYIGRCHLSLSKFLLARKSSGCCASFNQCRLYRTGQNTRILEHAIFYCQSASESQPLGLAQNRQEGWLSPTERASVSAISLRHNLATSGESNEHFGLPCVYAPVTIAVNVTWIERGFNACQMHRSMYPSIFYQ